MIQLQTPHEFLKDFNNESLQAKQRIYLRSMNFEVGKVMDILEPTLIKKAKEHLDIRISLDWVAQRYVHNQLPLLPTFSPTERLKRSYLHQENRKLRDRLRQAGVKVTQTNTPTLFSFLPMFRRNHMKLYIADQIAWIGGVNLFDEAFDMIDFMVKCTDLDIVEACIHQFSHIGSHQSNQNITINPQNSLLLDAGIINRSIIYDEAIKLCHRATNSIIFMSQFVPDGSLLEIFLQKAHAGCQISVITSSQDNPSFTHFPYKPIYQIFLRKIRNQPNISLTHLSKKVHAKLLLVDDQVAIFGSHNLVHLGVLLGTAEIALETRDQKLIEQLQAFVRESRKLKQ